jgi:hypothetical protein
VTARARGAAAAFALAMCLAGAAHRGLALDALELSLDAMQGPGWRSGAIHAQLRADAGGMLRLRIEVRDLVLPAPLHAARSATLECAAARASAAGMDCPDARLTLALAGAEPVRIAASVAVDAAAGTVQMRVARQSVAGGTLTLRLDLAPAALALDARFADLQAAQLQAATASALPVVASAGLISGELQLRHAATGGELSAALDLRGLAFSDAAGLHAGEGVDASLRLQGSSRGGALWRVQAQAAMSAGAIFADPVLLDVPGEPLRASVAGEWIPGQRLHLEQVELIDPGVASIAGTLEAVLGQAPRLQRVSASLSRTAADALYQRYLRPFAGAGLMSQLSLSGQLSAELDWRAEGASQASLALWELDVGDSAGRFAVLGLGGEAHWTRQRALRPSRLSWTDLQLHSLPFGAGSMDAELTARGARLLAPVSMPLLDGRVQLQRLHASDLGLAGQRVEADLSLTPVSLQRLSERLGWLPLSGSLAGDIPHLVYTQSRLAAEGDIRMQLFGGQVTLSGVAVEDPFGVVPRLHASARVQDIDLAVLTRAMSFGSIEGRLEGRVDGLVLEAWQPVAFDAVLVTPADDTSRHRISQRAVDNLASLGGANAVLSSTFLRFFKEFSYARLGLSCRLRAGVCEMGGVGRAERGYYIVKGGGLPPRVDVIGFNNRVDWTTLLDRLRAVASSPGPVVR